MAQKKNCIYIQKDRKRDRGRNNDDANGAKH